MLVLTRKVGETIVIADNIRITVVALGNGRAKIGIDAPQGVNIDRAEIHERKKAEAEGHAAPVTVGAPSENGSGLHNRLTEVFNGQRPELRKPR